METFLPVSGYEGSYLISNMGRLWSQHSKRFLRPSPRRGGYLAYALYKDGEKTRIVSHRLVAQAFIPNPFNYPQINHKDENKTNNRVENLEWCSAQYNLTYGTRPKRVSNALKNHPKFSKRVLCVETGVVYGSLHEAARQAGVAFTNLSAVCNGKAHRNTLNGFHWKFYEEE